MIRRCITQEEMSDIPYYCHSWEYWGHFLWCSKISRRQKMLLHGFLEVELLDAWGALCLFSSALACMGCIIQWLATPKWEGHIAPYKGAVIHMPIIGKLVWLLCECSLAKRYRLPRIIVSSNNNLYMFVAIEYVLKWVKAQAFTINDAKAVIRFLKKNIFTRFNTTIINDEGSHFCNKSIETLLAKYGVKLKVATTCHPQKKWTRQNF